MLRTSRYCITIYTDRKHRLLSEHLVIITTIVVDLEVFELVSSFRGRNNVQEITELLLLKIFLRQVLQVSLRERELCSDRDLVLVTTDGHFGSKISSFAHNFDFVMEELLKCAGSSTLSSSGAEQSIVNLAMDFLPAFLATTFFCDF